MRYQYEETNMRLIKLVLIVLIPIATCVFAQNLKFVQPIKNGVGLYKNETRNTYENAIVTVGVNDRLKVLREKKNHYQVQTDDGTVGWIEKTLVATASGKSFMFDDAEVIGYLDNPTPVYIIDANNKDGVPIKLDRSFADALRENIDRETVERLDYQ